MDLQGAVTGAGALSLGKADTTGDRTGNVRLPSPNANGISANTYSGGTTLSWGRVQINSDAFFTGPASAPTNIISSPFGTGPLTFRAIAGTSTLEAFGADRVVVNPMAATAYTINSSSTFFFAGRYSLNLANATQSVQLSTDGTARSRTLQANNTTGITTIAWGITQGGTNGYNVVKTGAGLLSLSGTNNSANIAGGGTPDANYGTGFFIGIVLLPIIFIPLLAFGQSPNQVEQAQ